MKRLIEWYRGWREKRQQLKKREEYERRAGGSECCPHCDTWSWEVGGWASCHVHRDEPGLDVLTCKKCGKSSNWLYGPGVFIYIHSNPESQGDSHELEPD